VQVESTIFGTEVSTRSTAVQPSPLPNCPGGRSSNPKNLKTLSVVNDFDGEVATIFDRVTLPALEDLAYEAIAPYQLTLDSSDTPHMDMFLNIGRLKDTFSQLTRITLLRVCIADSDILPLLRTLHALVYFHLFNVLQWGGIKRTSGSNVDKPIDPFWTPEDAQLLRLLTVTPHGLDTTSISQQSNDVLLPHLKRIHFYYPCFLKDHQAHARAYAALARSRLEHCAKGSALLDFQLTLSHSDSWATISSLRTAMDLELGRARSLENFTLERARDSGMSREGTGWKTSRPTANQIPSGMIPTEDARVSEGCSWALSCTIILMDPVVMQVFHHLVGHT